jgi:hypothetical protein
MRTGATIVGSHKASGCDIEFGDDVKIPLSDIISCHPAGDDKLAESVSIQIPVAGEYDAARLDRVGNIANGVVELHVKRQLVDESKLRLCIEKDGSAVVYALGQCGNVPVGGVSGWSLGPGGAGCACGACSARGALFGAHG